MTVEQASSTDGVETPTDGTETLSADAPAPPSRISVIRRRVRRSLARWPPILVVVLLIATTGLAAGVYFFQYRPDHQPGEAAKQQAIQAASDGVVALMSYSSDNLHRDFAEAKSHLTGDFLAYYNKFSEQVVTPAALQKEITATAGVLQAAVSELHPDSAVVLVFVNQSTRSKERPDPVVTPSSVLITLTKVQGSWLISKVDPV